MTPNHSIQRTALRAAADAERWPHTTALQHYPIMASIHPGTFVSLQRSEAAKLRYAPPALNLQVIVHRLAVPKSGKATPLTTVLHRNAGGTIDWIGSIDERMLDPAQTPGSSPRPELNQYLFLGPQCWDVVKPGLLVTPQHGNPYLTIYGGDRPWIVLGQLPNTHLLAVPLNDAWGNPKWYTPQIEGKDLLFPGSKLSQMELVHIWCLPNGVQRIGRVADAAQAKLRQDSLQYFP